MSLQNDADSSLFPLCSIASEFWAITAMLTGIYLWRQFLSILLPPVYGSLSAFGGALVSGSLFLGGIIIVLGGYAAFRDIEVGLELPSSTDLPIAGLAFLSPAILAGLTKFVGSATDVSYNSLTKTAVAADPPIVPVLVLTALGIFVSVPTLVLICQVLIQGSFERIVSSEIAIVLTTLVTGFVMMSNSGGLATVPDRGKLFGTILFALLLGVTLYASSRVERDWLRYLIYAPVGLFAAIIVISGIIQIESIAGGLFTATHITTLGIAAYTYGRTRSLVVPALAYASLLLANRAIVVVFEAGLQNW